MHDTHVELADGRALAYTDLGFADGTSVLFFHGAPVSRLCLSWLEDELASQRLRVVSPDRPGYGMSSPQPGRSMDDWANDVAALADALGIDRFLVAGHSSGGPYAVACAALLPERVAGGVVVAGVTDMAWPGAWEGYIDDEVEIMRQPDEEAAVAWCERRYGPDGSGWLSESIDLPAPDSALLGEKSAGDALMLSMVEAFRQGVGGYAQDVFVQGRPWPFDPARVRASVLVAHGEEDEFVPKAHSRHTAQAVPGAQLQMFPGHGHLSLLRELPAILAGLAPADG